MMTWFGWLDSYAALIILFAFKTYGIFLVKQYMESVPDYFVNAGRGGRREQDQSPSSVGIHQVFLPPPPRNPAGFTQSAN